MLREKTFLAIIPARGGSKGVPRKNIKLLANKPLIAWTIEAAKRSKYLDRIILSSEDAEIIEIAQKWGCEAPFIRPKELAADNTPGIDSVIHALNVLPEKYDYVLLLQPTSPFRQDSHIDQAIELIMDKKGQSLVSFCEVEENPHWMFRINDKGQLIKFIQHKKTFSRRQDFPELIIPNGAIYIAKSEWVLKSQKFIDVSTIVLKMDHISSLDIDNDWHWSIAECLMQKEHL